MEEGAYRTHLVGFLVYFAFLYNFDGCCVHVQDGVEVGIQGGGVACMERFSALIILGVYSSTLSPHLIISKMYARRLVGGTLDPVRIITEFERFRRSVHHTSARDIARSKVR